MEGIITAIIGGCCTAIPTIIATLSSNKKSTALTVYRIEQLEKKVEKHNSVMERTFKIEEDIKHIEEDISELKREVK